VRTLPKEMPPKASAAGRLSPAEAAGPAGNERTLRAAAPRKQPAAAVEMTAKERQVAANAKLDKEADLEIQKHVKKAAALRARSLKKAAATAEKAIASENKNRSVGAVSRDADAEPASGTKRAAVARTARGRLEGSTGAAASSSGLTGTAMTPATAKSATADKESNTSSSSSEDDSSDSAEETNKKAKTMAMKCATTEGSAEAGGQGLKANKLALKSDPKSEEGKTKELKDTKANASRSDVVAAATLSEEKVDGLEMERKMKVIASPAFMKSAINADIAKMAIIAQAEEASAVVTATKDEALSRITDALSAAYDARLEAIISAEVASSSRGALKGGRFLGNMSSLAARASEQLDDAWKAAPGGKQTSWGSTLR
jgi:hypothetical protein